MTPNARPGHSDTVTDGVRVRVAAQYQPDRSDPDRGEWFFFYRVMLSNEGERSAKLLSRHWVIVDALGERTEVRGPGVVGEEPLLQPGETFEYMSACPLGTEWGTMEGSYRMERDDGEEFDVRIGRFFLAPGVAPLSTLGAGVE